ncbi:hypothetical protein [Chitinophaga sp. sic0106]|uniref:hypothetical protein n=1 Tax=Chitinophaga sp. sic0106 TaxID=2854785 RepID=UPI001C4836D1|nr:hypothetical protein [Chitinophaga sp. sic0106]MBV7531756.1 hypothetical protein [Chitinophaga sp. sic0106]
MKYLLCILCLLSFTVTTYSQKVYQIRADSVRIYNVCDTAELILENSTQGVNGYLVNKGAGRTEFRKIQMEKIGTSQIAIVGQDTLDLSTLPGISGVDTIYRMQDYIYYVKKGITYNVYAPMDEYKNIPIDSTASFFSFPPAKITGFNAYQSPDMPMTSDQALKGNEPYNNYYTGHVSAFGANGYQFAVNWDGEQLGPQGAFIRIKDDTQPAWSPWRELLFKDYADAKYANNSAILDTIHHLSLQDVVSVRDTADRIVLTTNNPSLVPTTQAQLEINNTSAGGSSVIFFGMKGAIYPNLSAYIKCTSEVYGSGPAAANYTTLNFNALLAGGNEVNMLKLRPLWIGAGTPTTSAQATFAGPVEGADAGDNKQFVTLGQLNKLLNKTILNQTDSIQTGNFKINRNAYIGGTVEAAEVKTSSISVGGLKWITGTGAPEGVVSAPVGSLYTRTDGGPGTTLYVKESGTDATGWVAK